jgi:hypothetical protein
LSFWQGQLFPRTPSRTTITITTITIAKFLESLRGPGHRAGSFFFARKDLLAINIFQRKY